MFYAFIYICVCFISLFLKTKRKEGKKKSEEAVMEEVEAVAGFGDAAGQPSWSRSLP